MRHLRNLLVLSWASFACGSIVLACGSDDSGNNGTPDASADVTSHDGSLSDTSVSDSAHDGASGCTPTDEPSFTPTYHASVSPSEVCNNGDIEDYVTACLSSTSTLDSCNTWVSGHGTCGQCLDSKVDASTPGVVLWVGNRKYYFLNTAGCIAAIDHDTTASGCAGAWQAREQCANAACSTNCPVSSNSDLPAYAACEDNARTKACAASNTTVNQKCSELLDGSTYAKCLPNGQPNNDLFRTIAAVLCNPNGVGDASIDAPSDAAADSLSDAPAADAPSDAADSGG